MCRNIRTLHNFEPPATPDEIRAASLQYVRKISGTSAPSKANEAAARSAAAWSRSTTTTLAPRPISASAVAKPMPRAPPVTSATLPSRA